MTPKEIIEALEEYFENRMDEEVDLESIGYAFLDTYYGDKNIENLLFELNNQDVDSDIITLIESM